MRHPLLTIVAFLAGGIGATAFAAGTWSPVVTAAPNNNAGVMLLLSDGTIICKTDAGAPDGYGVVWNKLTPNIHGSYANGTWSSIAPMIRSRWYFSSQLLQDGRVYVAGGEYGTGKSAGEIYNPLTNVWSTTVAPGATVSDANSEMLPDGRVMQALVAGNLRGNVIYDPVMAKYFPAASCLGIHNESVWLKLRDDSILFVDRHSTASERYIPALETWVADATVPVALYDDFGFETGAAELLPDGRAFFIGATGLTAYYTPSGTASPGVWTAGPTVPNGRGQPDAPTAMMVNGKILCTVSPVPVSGNVFQSPTWFYEFDTQTNVFTLIGAPGGGQTLNDTCYTTTFLDLPDGTVLYAHQGSPQYYIYTPDGSPLAAGKPVVTSVQQTGTNAFTLTGRLFNGISEGASYGDDWQMNTNYPVVRLAQQTPPGTNIYYARTFNWNSTGVQTGALVTTTQMTVPAAVPFGTYAMFVTANGIASDAATLWYPNPACRADLNYDHVVDGADLGLLLANWGTMKSGDINGDQVIDGADLGLLLAAWGVCPG